MAEEPRPGGDDLARIARQHLQSLQAAGLEWLPKATAMPEAPAKEPVRAAVAGCTRCAELVYSRSRTVFGVGPPDAELCFLGEAPGSEEDKQGEPFVGP